jgi:hypothetical protein
VRYIVSWHVHFEVPFIKWVPVYRTLPSFFKKTSVTIGQMPTESVAIQKNHGIEISEPLEAAKEPDVLHTGVIQQNLPSDTFKTGKTSLFKSRDIEKPIV